MDTNDYQPCQIDESTVLCDTEDFLCSLPKRIHLTKLCAVLVRTKLVLRYYKPNKDSQPEKYAHHMLMLFYPFRQESELLCNDTFSEKLADLSVVDVVN